MREDLIFYYIDKYTHENLPKIVVEPPGPRAREILSRDNEYIMQSFVRWYPLVAKRAYGVAVEDVDGNTYIDYNSGLAVMNVGHSHPLVVEKIRKQVEKLIHYSLTDFYYEEAVRYSEKILTKVPVPGKGKVFFTNSGTESIEGSIKITRGYHKGSRPYIIAFYGAFHGRTTGSMALSASKPIHRKGFQPLMSGVIHVPYPYPYRCPFAAEPEECGDAVIGFMEDWVFSKLVDPTEVAAVFIEPIQGEGGYVVPPSDFFPKLRKLTEKHGILLVVDEVQSGFGRTGKWFAIEHWGVKPDLIATAKAIASGLPLGAIFGRDDVMTLPGGSHANTFGGNPVALAAAEAVYEILDAGAIENASRVGESIMRRVREWVDKYEIVGDVRGKGLMIGVELVESKESKKPLKKGIGDILNRAFRRGVALIGAGVSTIRIAPPLVITEEIAHKALDIVEEMIADVDKEVRGG